jgi:hypothetical protein
MAQQGYIDATVDNRGSAIAFWIRKLHTSSGGVNEAQDQMEFVIYLINKV